MIGETVTVLSRVTGPLDRYGKPTYSWPLPGFEVDGVLVAPGKSVEGNETIREQVDTACSLYRFPSDVAVDPFARVVVRGRTWSVDGSPAKWDNGAWQPGSVLDLKTVEG